MRKVLRSAMAERVNTVEGELDARGLRFGVVASKFNDFIVNRLVSAAIDTLIKKGADAGDIEVVRVPGAFEIPLALKKLANSKRYDALIALGCVIRGDTPHFDYICSSVTNSIMYISIKNKKPIGFGILTCLNKKQALLRSDPHKKNKGKEAALAIFSVHNSK